MKNSLINFLFEAAALKRLQRTGWQVLGGRNEESIAEHSFMVCVISYLLALELKANLEEVLLLALFHDFAEARTGDIYKLADFYTRGDDKKAIKDAFTNLPDSGKIIKLLEEYEEEKIPEAKIVHDADTLALCLELKQLMENGNLNAKEWLEANLKSLRLKESQQIGREIQSTNSQDWWKKERRILHDKMAKRK